MTLLEFVAFCKLAGLIQHHMQIDDWHHKMVIVQDTLRLELLFGIDVLGRAEIHKAFLSNGMYIDYNPPLDIILKAFFPSN